VIVQLLPNRQQIENTKQRNIELICE